MASIRHCWPFQRVRRAACSTMRWSGATPQVWRRRATRSGAIFVGIERADIDAAMHDRDARAHERVAGGYEVGGVVGVGDDDVASRHHAVVEALERVGLAVGAVVGGHERNAGLARGDERAPGRRAAAGVYQIDGAGPYHARDGAGVGQDLERVLGRRRKGHCLGADGLQSRRQSPGLGQHDRLSAAAHDGLGHLHRRHFGAAGIELRDDLQYGRPLFRHQRFSPLRPRASRTGFTGWHRMAGSNPQFLTVGSGAEQRRIAYLLEPAAGSDKPGLVWLCGLKSDMVSTKASAVAEWAASQGCACLRFDYSGHGQSDGKFEDGTVSRWLEETRAAFTSLTHGPQVLVGSSMGGYMALLLLRALLAEAPRQAQRITGLVLIAPAWDMTELMWQRFPQSARRDIAEKGIYLRPSDYGDGPYPITRAFLEDGRKHLIGSEPFDPGRPVHIMHGLQDPDVPWEHTLDLVAHLSGDWTRVAAVPDGEHRLSRPQDIALLLETIAAVSEAAGFPTGN